MALVCTVWILSLLLLPPFILLLMENIPPSPIFLPTGPKEVYFPILFLFLDKIPSVLLKYPPVMLGIAPQDMWVYMYIYGVFQS